MRTPARWALGALLTPFLLAAVRARSDVTAKTKAADQDRGFSERIRGGLLPRPAGG